MDYRSLLKKYMNEVGLNEGIYFLPISNVSNEENKELQRIADEINKEDILRLNQKGKSFVNSIMESNHD